jgi:hypothetical protein
VVLAMAVAASATSVAGCGGGGDDSTGTATSAAPNLPTVTSPQMPDGQAQGNAQGGGSTTAAPQAGAPSGAPAVRLQNLLGPFRDCLSSHGVDPGEFRQGFEPRAPAQRQAQPDPAGRQKQIQAGIACIPTLPPRLRSAAERLAKRYEQRNG